MEFKSIHQIMGISDEREQEIAKEVLDALTEAGMVDIGIEKLIETYDAEAMLAGIRLLWLIHKNRKARERPGTGAIIKQNAPMN